jgi:hypothetical protein
MHPPALKDTMPTWTSCSGEAPGMMSGPPYTSLIEIGQSIEPDGLLIGNK